MSPFNNIDRHVWEHWLNQIESKHHDRKHRPRSLLYPLRWSIGLNYTLNIKLQLFCIKLSKKFTMAMNKASNMCYLFSSLVNIEWDFLPESFFMCMPFHIFPIWWDSCDCPKNSRLDNDHLHPRHLNDISTIDLPKWYSHLGLHGSFMYSLWQKIFGTFN
jgi:hypothetical protein